MVLKIKSKVPYASASPVSGTMAVLGETQQTGRTSARALEQCYTGLRTYLLVPFSCIYVPRLFKIKLPPKKKTQY